MRYYCSFMQRGYGFTVYVIKSLIYGELSSSQSDFTPVFISTEPVGGPSCHPLVTTRTPRLTGKAGSKETQLVTCTPSPIQGSQQGSGPPPVTHPPSGVRLHFPVDESLRSPGQAYTLPYDIICFAFSSSSLRTIFNIPALEVTEHFFFFLYRYKPV